MQIIPSTVCSDAFITLDFQKILPACRQGYFHWYISINPTTYCNLGTKYWIYGVARKLFEENSGWSSTPRLGERLWNMLEGWIEGAARTEDAKRPRIDGEAWGRARGEGLGRGLGEFLPRKILKILKFILGSWNHAFWRRYSWSENLNFRPANLGNFRRFSNDFDTFQSNAYLGVKESPFFKNMYVVV